MFDLYGFLVNLVLGALLLLVFPSFARRVAARSVSDAARYSARTRGVRELAFTTLPTAFATLPTAFATMPLGRVVAVGPFGLLFFAALSSAVALLEVGVAAAETTTRLSRRRATLLLTGGGFVAGSYSALSYSPTALALGDRPVLDLVDESVGPFALPVSALLSVFVFVRRNGPDPVRDELGVLYPLVRWLMPVVLVVTAARTVGSPDRRGESSSTTLETVRSDRPSSPRYSRSPVSAGDCGIDCPRPPFAPSTPTESAPSPTGPSPDWSEPAATGP